MCYSFVIQAENLMTDAEVKVDRLLFKRDLRSVQQMESKIDGIVFRTNAGF